MSQSAQPYRNPEASPIGQAGTRVQIQERQAWSISGWFGVLVVAACIAAVYELLQHSHSVIAIAIGVLGHRDRGVPGDRPARRRPRSCGSSAATSAPCGAPACLDSCH